jgi:hypothetical protein
MKQKNRHTNVDTIVSILFFHKYFCVDCPNYTTYILYMTHNRMHTIEGLGQLKNLMTSSGIKPETFWLVAQCLNQLCYCVPL